VAAHGRCSMIAHSVRARRDLRPYWRLGQGCDPGVMAPSDARKRPRPAQSGELPEQLITDVFKAAIAAPATHNTQPMRFRVLRQAQIIELRPAQSAHGRMATRAAALCTSPAARCFNMRLAVAVAGRHPVVQLLPDPDQPLLLAAPSSITVRRSVCSSLPRRRSASQSADPAYRAELAHWAAGVCDTEGIPDSAIAVSPLTQPLETADAWLVRDPRTGSEPPQMILRIGYGLPVSPAPRRPVAEILDE
jgi:hypothetical protein